MTATGQVEDIIAVVALYRPGPMDNINYIQRHGEEAIDHLHPMLEGILNETYGIAIYQEQVMELHGFSRGIRLAAPSASPSHGQEDSGRNGGAAQEFHRWCGRERRSKDRGRYLCGSKNSRLWLQQVSRCRLCAGCLSTAPLKANYPVEFLAAR